MRKNEDKTEEKSIAVKSLHRAADILNAICNGSSSITEISEICHLSKSTVHRLLQGLTESNLVMQDPVKRRYYLGFFIARMVSKTQISHEYLISCAKQEMERLSQITKETITLSILMGPKYMDMRVVPSRLALRVIESRGEVDEVHRGATGKVLLAQLNDAELEIILRSLKLGSNDISDYNIVQKDELIAQLKRIKSQGYAVSAGEKIEGGICISAPIQNYILPVSLSIVGPETRMKPNVTEYIKEALHSATSISSKTKELFLMS